MADVPETCPFCGAPKSPTSDIPELDYLGWECGASLEGLNIPDDIYREPECFIRELRPKAEALDRLEEMAKNARFRVATYIVWEDDEMAVKTWPENFRSIDEHGPDLPAAINAAYKQWKEPQ